MINCAILKGLKYNQPTPTSLQWRDNEKVFGLSFLSEDDAIVFANAMLKSLEVSISNPIFPYTQKHFQVLNSGGQLQIQTS